MQRLFLCVDFYITQFTQLLEVAIILVGSIQSANRDILTLSFPICIPLVSFSFVMVQTKLPVLDWTAVVRVGILFWFWIWAEMLPTFPPFNMMLALDVWIYCLDSVEERFLYIQFFKDLMKECCILSNAIDIITLFLISLMWLNHICLCMVNSPCVPGIHPAWPGWVIFLMCCWSWLVGFLLRIFAYTIFHQGYHSIVFCCIFFWFWGLRWCCFYRSNLGGLSHLFF